MLLFNLEEDEVVWNLCSGLSNMSVNTRNQFCSIAVGEGGRQARQRTLFLGGGRADVKG